VIVDIGRIASIEKLAVYGVLTPRSNNIQLCRPVASHWQTLSHNVVTNTHRLSGIQTHNVSNNLGKNMLTNIETD
jgi:hypothetical protein